MRQQPNVSVCLIKPYYVHFLHPKQAKRGSDMSEPNWKNRTLWTGDNLDILHELRDSRPHLPGPAVQL